MVRRLSRLQRVRRKRETRQGIFYLAIAVSAVIALIFWGVPTLANWASLFFAPDDSEIVGGDFDLNPTPPVIFDLPEATPSATIDVEGLAQPGVDVVLHLNNIEYDTVLSDDTGSFIFDNVELGSGDNFLFAVAISNSGKKSEPSQSYKVVIDRQAPEITVDTPGDGAQFVGESERLVVIEGFASEDVVSVYVNDRKAILTPEKTFSVRYQLEEGEQEILIIAEDSAGNQGKASLNLSWIP